MVTGSVPTGLVPTTVIVPQGTTMVEYQDSVKVGHISFMNLSESPGGLS